MKTQRVEILTASEFQEARDAGWEFWQDSPNRKVMDRAKSILANQDAKTYFLGERDGSVWVVFLGEGREAFEQAWR